MKVTRLAKGYTLDHSGEPEPEELPSNIDIYIEALREKIVERALMDFCISDKELADLEANGLIGAGKHERVNAVTSTMTRDEIQKHFDHFVELKARNRTNNE